MINKHKHLNKFFQIFRKLEYICILHFASKTFLCGHSNLKINHLHLVFCEKREVCLVGNARLPPTFRPLLMAFFSTVLLATCWHKRRKDDGSFWNLIFFWPAFKILLLAKNSIKILLIETWMLTKKRIKI